MDSFFRPENFYVFSRFGSAHIGFCVIRVTYTAFHFNFYEILLLVKWVVRRFAKSFKNFLNRLEFCAVNNLRRAD